MAEVIRIGSRRSKLALVQSEYVRRLVESRSDRKCEIVTLDTKGDKILDRSLPAIGDKGLFTKELEEKLLDGSIDMAVHSLKDLPTDLPGGLALGAVPAREDPRDALVADAPGPTLESFPVGARIATGSLRRRVQIMKKRPDIIIEDLRGNVPTRISRLKERNLDGIILAVAGLKRLGLESNISQVFATDYMIPAAGQGALGIEVRGDDEEIGAILERLDDPRARLETQAERSILNGLGGSCQVPIGINARIEGDGITIAAFVSDLEAELFIEETLSGPVAESEELAAEITRRLVDRGALRIISDIASGGGDET
jgi:hydroxymethylbilane synthase